MGIAGSFAGGATTPRAVAFQQQGRFRRFNLRSRAEGKYKQPCHFITKPEDRLMTSSDKAIHRDNVARDFRHGMRGESASRCIGPISKGGDVFGLTKGDFSMIDVLRHIAREIGPCRVDIGTWTAARAEIGQAFDMLNDKNITSMRWLVDRSFPARQGKYFASLLDKFGQDSVRLARFHAKFILLENDGYSVAVRTSMNLNENKRIEFFEISEGSPISGYLREVVDYHFAAPPEDSYAAFKDFKVGGDAPRSASVEKVRVGGWD
jgi:hypothetical protein